MKKILGSGLALSAIIVVLNAQDAPTPYVASVKKSGDGFGAQMRIAPGMISARGVPVRLLMRQAFGQLQDFQLVGGPDWINSDRFDIEAKIEGGGLMSPQIVQSVLRQILDVAPERWDIHLRTAQAFEEVGRMAEAIALYEKVAAVTLRSGSARDALQIYEHVAGLAPREVAKRLRVAELYSREKDIDAAVRHFELGADLLWQAGKAAELMSPGTV